MLIGILLCLSYESQKTTEGNVALVNEYCRSEKRVFVYREDTTL